MLSWNLLIEVREYCDVENINQKFLCKVAEEKYLKAGKMIYLGITVYSLQHMLLTYNLSITYNEIF